MLFPAGGPNSKCVLKDLPESKYLLKCLLEGKNLLKCLLEGQYLVRDLPEGISAALRATLPVWKGGALMSIPVSLHLPGNSQQQCCVHHNPLLSLTPLQEAKLALGQAALDSNASRCIPVQPQAALQEFWGRSLEEKVISVYWDSWDLPGLGLDRGKLSSQKKLVIRLTAKKPIQVI